MFSSEIHPPTIVELSIIAVKSILLSLPQRQSFLFDVFNYRCDVVLKAQRKYN